jgi:C_GCAxxG_C_C family probable redox protein
MTRTDTALSLFSEGYNCAQAILAAFAPEGAADREVYLKISSAFGSGIASTGSTCGAVTGALMAIGMNLGPSQKGHPIHNLKLERKYRKFLKEFNSRHSTTLCNPLRGKDNDGKYRKGEKERCPGFVRTAAEILEEML